MFKFKQFWIYSKDLWSENTDDTPKIRSGVAGYASIGNICNSNRYSLSEDQGGFMNSITIAHEIGHNLGALHDRDVGCKNEDNYIMTPVLNSNPPQTNFYMFSSCSIKSIKTVLLNSELR